MHKYTGKVLIGTIKSPVYMYDYMYDDDFLHVDAKLWFWDNNYLRNKKFHTKVLDFRFNNIIGIRFTIKNLFNIWMKLS